MPLVYREERNGNVGRCRVIASSMGDLRESCGGAIAAVSATELSLFYTDRYKAVVQMPSVGFTKFVDDITGRHSCGRLTGQRTYYRRSKDIHSTDVEELLTGNTVVYICAELTKYSSANA